MLLYRELFLRSSTPFFPTGVCLDFLFNLGVIRVAPEGPIYRQFFCRLRTQRISPNKAKSNCVKEPQSEW